MPRQPRSSRLRCGSDRVDHSSSHRHPCANGHRFSMAMPPSCSINPRGGSTPSPPWVGCVSARSEEHTSELQSLMRISYAVFCLKKKNHTTIALRHPHTESRNITHSTIELQM